MLLILGYPVGMTWMNGIPKNPDDTNFTFCIFVMLYLSPKVPDEMLVETVVPIVTDKYFSLDYIRKINVHELAAKLKPLGMQNKRAEHLKKAADHFLVKTTIQKLYRSYVRIPVATQPSTYGAGRLVTMTEVDCWLLITPKIDLPDPFSDLTALPLLTSNGRVQLRVPNMPSGQP